MTEFVKMSCSHFLQKLFAAVRREDTNEILKILQVDNIDSLKTYTDDNGDPLLHLAWKHVGFFEIIEIPEILLDLGVDINAKDKSGKTILHLACESQHTSVIDLCIQRNADLNASDNNGDTTAHLVIEDEKLRISKRSSMGLETNEVWCGCNSSFVGWMVDQGVDFYYAKNRRGLSALYLAIDYGLYHILPSLLEGVTDLPSVEKDQTPLLSYFSGVSSTRASSDSQYNLYEPIIVKIILKKSKFISDDTLSSYLRMAITGAKHEMSVIDMLLQRARTNVNLHKAAHGSKSLLETLFNEQSESHQGQSIAQILYSRDPCMKMLQLLKDFEVDFDVRDMHGRSFLHLVSKYGKRAKMIDLVMNDKCDVNVTDSEGETPLHVAVSNHNSNIVKALIDHGANVNAKDDNGRTPLHVASKSVNSEIAQLLLEAGANVNAKDKIGKTPLHYVLLPNVAEVLQSSGAHVDILDVNGYSPLYDLLFNGRPHQAVIEMLKYGADIHNSKIFQFLHENSESSDWTITNKWLYLKQHFIKLNAIDVHCKLPFTTAKYLDRNNQLFLKGCLKEVGSLKNYFIDDRTSVYCFLHKNRNRRCAYLHNEKLKNLVEDAAVEQKFPNYSVLILGCYNEAVRRKPLLDSATHILNELSQTILPDLCIDEILIFLSNGDLLRFIEAFENVNLENTRMNTMKY